jgi:hypothetical protein
MRLESRRTQNEKKNTVCNAKNVLFLLLILGWSLGFAFQTPFVELERR